MSHYVACLLQSDMMGGRPGFYICSVLSNMTKVVEFSNSCSKLNWQILVEYNEKLLVLIHENITCKTFWSGLVIENVLNLADKKTGLHNYIMQHLISHVGSVLIKYIVFNFKACIACQFEKQQQPNAPTQCLSVTFWMR